MFIRYIKKSKNCGGIQETEISGGNVPQWRKDKEQLLGASFIT
jgi:hypothetical protein